jgi:hypothetical protein
MLNPFPKHVELCLEGKFVGTIELNRFADSWLFGSFEPTRGFSEFAALFGEWSLLIHADENDPQISRAALDEMAKIERVIDGLHVELRLPENGDCVAVTQINIDGNLVELKLAEEWGMQ